MSARCPCKGSSSSSSSRDFETLLIVLRSCLRNLDVDGFFLVAGWRPLSPGCQSVRSWRWEVELEMGGGRLGGGSFRSVFFNNILSPGSGAATDTADTEHVPSQGRNDGRRICVPSRADRGVVGEPLALARASITKGSASGGDRACNAQFSRVSLQVHL